MRYVHFKRVKITNFLSVGKKPVEVDFKPGLNIITGRNYDKADRANGVGKSAVADAIHFALYGSTIRELKKENIVNDQAPDALCEVELVFTYEQDKTVNECKIIRTINPTKCFLYINGEDKTLSGVPQTTDYIVNLIKTSPEVFQNSVVMTINNTVPFMAQKKVEKRKFIEGILGLEVFSNMLLFVRHDFNETKRTIDVEASKYEEIGRTLQENIKQRDAFEINKQKRLEVLQTRRTNNEQELALLRERFDNIKPVDSETQKIAQEKVNTLAAAFKTLDDMSDVVQKAITEAHLHIKINNDRLKNLKRIDSKCPGCGRDLAESANAQYEKDKATCEQEIETYTKVIEVEGPKLANIETKILKVRDLIKTADQELADVSIRKKEIENIKSRELQLQAWQQQLIIDIGQLNKDSNSFQGIVTETMKRQEASKSTITELQERIDMIENAKLIVSEEGVKSYIVKKIIEVLNGRLAFYLKKLESNSMVKFNEFFEETITNERGKECSYFNFSGAERKAIDLAMLFTFQDIRRAQADVWLNMSIFDELIDSSLDEKGIELVLDILKDRVDKYSESIYIISHRKESKKYCMIGGEIVFLVKKNGITTRTTNYDFS